MQRAHTRWHHQVFVQVGDEVIELKGVELEALLQTQKEMQDEIASEKATALIKLTQRQAVLDRLGITSEEAKLLLS